MLKLIKKILIVWVLITVVGLGSLMIIFMLATEDHSLGSDVVKNALKEPNKEPKEVKISK